MKEKTKLLLINGLTYDEKLNCLITEPVFKSIIEVLFFDDAITIFSLFTRIFPKNKLVGVISIDRFRLINQSILRLIKSIEYTMSRKYLKKIIFCYWQINYF